MDRCNRWFSAPVERCACVAHHRGPCRRERELPHGEYDEKSGTFLPKEVE